MPPMPEPTAAPLPHAIPSSPAGPPTLAFRRLHPDAVLPTRGHDTSAGLDLYPIEGRWIPRKRRELIPTGLAVEIPPGYVGIIKDRSSVALRGLEVHAGVIDAEYRGEVKVLMRNSTDGPQAIGHPAEDGSVKPIAQLLVVPCCLCVARWADELSETARGDGGFGSTDIKPRETARP